LRRFYLGRLAELREHQPQILGQGRGNHAPVLDCVPDKTNSFMEERSGRDRGGGIVRIAQYHHRDWAKTGAGISSNTGKTRSPAVIALDKPAR
jgi:hypothetical protein